MNYNKLMMICWIFILGVVIATVKMVNMSYVPYIYYATAILVISGFLFHLVNKNKIGGSGKLPLILFLIGAFLFGYARYNQKRNFSDPHHISKYAEEGWSKKVYQIIGKIAADPDVYYDKTRITIIPYKIKLLYIKQGREKQIISQKEYDDVTGGNVLLQIKRAAYKSKGINPIWKEFSKSESYGKIVKITGSLVKPRQASNPYGFDDRKLKNDENVYAAIYNPEKMSVINRDNFADAAEKNTYNKNIDKWNPWYHLTVFSLSVKDKMLNIFKKTMPYPESAFLGGVTLGLRRGLVNLPNSFNPFYRINREAIEKDDNTKLKKFMQIYNPQKNIYSSKKLKEMYSADFPKIDFKKIYSSYNKTIDLEFKWAGVNHVLAVSGLHVTIITIFLFALFSILKTPRKIFAPFLVLALVIFTIITGARPSTVRAALMNSIGVLTMLYSAKGFRASALFAIASAGFIILVHNPLIIYSPSFTLSFGAVLSLVLLTTPVDTVLCKLRGLSFFWIVFLVLCFFFMAKYHWFILVNPSFIIPVAVVCTIINLILKKYEDNFPSLNSYGYETIPTGLRQFVSAQFAIQIGMMIPLSGYYFAKYPLAGSLANFIAIPLIGVIVQLGMLAGILGMLPGVGSWLALIINATNWLACKFFLATAWFFCEILPYPHYTSWTIGRLILVYTIIGIFIWWNAFNKKKEEFYLKLGLISLGEENNKLKIFEKLFAIVVIVILVYFTQHKKPEGVEITTLSVGYANSNVIKLATGKTLLINGASRNIDSLNHFKEFDQGDRVVFDYLKKQGIIKLDAVVLQSLSPEYMTGLYTIAQYADIKVWYDQIDHTKVNSKSSIKDFFEATGDFYYAKRPEKDYVLEIYEPYIEILKILEERGIPVKQAVAGTNIFEEKINGIDFKLMCLHPKKDDNKGIRTHANNSLVLKSIFGKKSVLFGGNIYEIGLNRFIENNDKGVLKSDVLIAPGHGAPTLLRWNFDRENIDDRLAKYTNDILNAVRPKVVIASFSKPRNGANWKRSFKRNPANDYLRLARNAFKEYMQADKFYNTDEDLTVLIKINKDGTDMKIESMKEMLQIKKEKSDMLKKNYEHHDVDTNMEDNQY